MRTALIVAALAIPSLALAQPAPEGAPSTVEPIAQRVPTIQILDTFNPKVNRVRWYAVSADEGMSDQDFYRLVGRNDLADDVHAHHVRAGVAIAGSAVAMGFAMYELVASFHQPDVGGCFTLANSVPDTQACVQSQQMKTDTENQQHHTPALIGGAASLGLAAYAVYELASAPRVSSAEAHALAEQYNATHVAPYVAPGGGGVSVGGSF